MVDTDLPSYDFLNHLADAASAAILPHFRKRLDVESKTEGDFDPVTAADRNAEAAIRRLITEHFPDHGIVGEEFGNERADARDVWVIDPIDGTRAFIAGIPVWGVLIGLRREGYPVLGMMAQPFTGERFYGNGADAWYRGPDGQSRPMTTRACASLEGATMFTTSPALYQPGEERDAYDRLERSVRLSRYGVDCYAFAMVADGHVDLTVEPGLQPYDIVALIPVVEGAGGQVTSWEGGSAAEGGNVVASGDSRMHKAALEILSGIA